MNKKIKTIYWNICGLYSHMFLADGLWPSEGEHVPAAAGWSSPPGGFVCTGSDPRSAGCLGQSALPGWHWGDGAGGTGPSRTRVRGWSAPLLQGSKVTDAGYGKLAVWAVMSDLKHLAAVWFQFVSLQLQTWTNEPELLRWIIIYNSDIIITCVALNCD